MPRHIALVLGAGGVVGGAFHAGVLAALAEVGWDARSADLVVGTSAGSGLAATIRLGVPPADLLAGATGEPMSEVGRAFASEAGPMPDLTAALRDAGRGPRRYVPGAPHLAVRAMRRPWEFRPFVAFAGLAPHGRVPTDLVGDRIRRTHRRDWPEEATWICAVDLADGRRVVFGRDRTDAHIATAVEASSAIPGFFRPVEHAGRRFIDGGAHSPTNADLAAGLGFDLVIVSSPMSATRDAIRRPAFTGARAVHAATLRREVAAVRAQGTPVLVLQPDAAVVDAAGLNAMDPRRRGAVAAAAHRSTLARLRRPDTADRVALLTS